ncbi:DUF1320 domain-containing protein [Paremcibacter congregatus]|uniref:gp436 family protein n=1 Tax=Paremcibacter congregatus TaxID=2043170 RepID=UPI0030EC1719|tara:strand:+ start:585 stop:1322 length:738 start_codon:yes stop_codon:yes gene_type:complete
MTANLTKQPAEEFFYNAPVDGIIEGEFVNAVNAVTIQARGHVAEVMPLVHRDLVYSGRTVQFILQGGTDGEDYRITLEVQDSKAQIHEIDVELRVEDFTWAIPDGSAGAYLTPSEYITRVGYDETLLLSDTHDIGRIDKDRLGARLMEASAVVDGYVARRYLTPLSPVPEVIKGLVADLTRFALHGVNVPDVVALRNKQALSRMKDIAAGSMVLSLPETTSAGTGGAPDFTSPTRVFNRNSLKGF